MRRKLKELQRNKIFVPVSVDEKGYYDRECPNPDCLFQFKVNAEDWKNLFSDEGVYCPKCRHQAKSDSWWTTQQLEEAKRQAVKHIRAEINNAVRLDAESFNRSQSRGGFIKLSMKVSGSSRQHFMLPIPAQKEMQLEIQCDQCRANYAVIGSAFFCPCCGHSLVEKTFDDAINTLNHLHIFPMEVLLTRQWHQ